MTQAAGEYQKRIHAVLAELGIPLELISKRGLVLQPEAQDLVLVAIDAEGRRQKLAPVAAKAWSEMQAAAKRKGVVLEVASAFRSVDRQVEIVRKKLAAGQSMDAIFSVVAPPGYSEHHTGRALDITTDGAAPVELDFERTEAFRWLSENAKVYGFELSFPRGNRYGFQYEPWHWRLGGAL